MSHDENLNNSAIDQDFSIKIKETYDGALASTVLYVETQHFSTEIGEKASPSVLVISRQDCCWNLPTIKSLGIRGFTDGWLQNIQQNNYGSSTQHFQKTDKEALTKSLSSMVTCAFKLS